MTQRDKIAFVCTGNTCRSPMAEGIFNKLAAEKGVSVVAESFGVATISGLTASEQSVSVCKEIGVDLTDFRSTEINDVNIEDYKHIYCMSQSHAKLLSEYYFVPADDISVLSVDDPYGGSTEIYRICRDEIYNSVEEIIKEYEN